MTPTSSSLPWGVAMDKTFELLPAKGVAMLAHLSLTFDTTAREGKNKHMAMWAAWFVSTGTFRSVQDANGQVGHTHNKHDHRFLVSGGVLARQTLLQTPNVCFPTCQQHIHRAGARELDVNELEVAWGWQVIFCTNPY